jgi:hypothetical protein
MKIIQIDGQEAKVNDEDFDRVSHYTWHLRKGKPRACVYLKPVGHPELNAIPYQITLERFVYCLTPYTNVKIHHLFGDELNCARNTMFLEKKSWKKPSMFIGVFKREDGYYYMAYDKAKGPFVLEQEAAEAYDQWIITQHGFRAKTNFYPQLLEQL